MLSRPTLLFWVVFLFIVTLSIFSHYQKPKTSQFQVSNLDTKALTEPQTRWQTALSKLPQFGAPETTPSIASKPITGIESSRLIGIVLDTPKRAIVMHPESGKVMRIGIGEGWLPGWTLIETRINHVVWQKESMEEQYRQMLFTTKK